MQWGKPCHACSGEGQIKSPENLNLINLIHPDTGQMAEIKICHRARLLLNVQSQTVDVRWMSRKEDGFA